MPVYPFATCTLACTISLPRPTRHCPNIHTHTHTQTTGKLERDEASCNCVHLYSLSQSVCPYIATAIRTRKLSTSPLCQASDRWSEPPPNSQTRSIYLSSSTTLCRSSERYLEHTALESQCWPRCGRQMCTLTACCASTTDSRVAPLSKSGLLSHYHSSIQFEREFHQSHSNQQATRAPADGQMYLSLGMDEQLGQDHSLANLMYVCVSQAAFTRLALAISLTYAWHQVYSYLHQMLMFAA